MTANKTTKEGYYRLILTKYNSQIEILYYGDGKKMNVPASSNRPT